MAFAGVGDMLTVSPADTLSLIVDGPQSAALKGEGDNLVLRAARLLAKVGNVKPRAEITLTKRLPIASGIGGGSADAAAGIRLLMDLWHLDIPADEITALALEIGADVPICLSGQAAQVSGVGDIISGPLKLPPAWLILANPGVAVSTAGVFSAHTPTDGASRSPGDVPGEVPGEVPGDFNEFVEYLATRRNDLTDAAVTMAPVIKSVLGALQELTGTPLCRMSGSGATCFALFADQSTAQAGAKQLKSSQPDWWVEVAPLLSDISEMALNS